MFKIEGKINSFKKENKEFFFFFFSWPVDLQENEEMLKEVSQAEGKLLNGWKFKLSERNKKINGNHKYVGKYKKLCLFLRVYLKYV